MTPSDTCSRCRSSDDGIPRSISFWRCSNATPSASYRLARSSSQSQALSPIPRPTGALCTTIRVAVRPRDDDGRYLAAGQRQIKTAPAGHAKSDTPGPCFRMQQSPVLHRSHVPASYDPLAARRRFHRKEPSMTTPLSTTAGADLLAPFGRGRGSLQDSFWYTGWLLTFLATGDQTQGRFEKDYSGWPSPDQLLAFIGSGLGANSNTSEVGLLAWGCRGW